MSVTVLRHSNNSQTSAEYDAYLEDLAQALADERDRARAPFLALADDLKREASFGDGTQRAYELDDLADRIRHAAEENQ